MSEACFDGNKEALDVAFRAGTLCVEHTVLTVKTVVDHKRYAQSVVTWRSS